MHIKLKIITSKPIAIALKLILIVLILWVLVFCIYLIYEQYIIYKTEQTFNLLKDAYQKTVETSNFQWEEGKMNTDVLAEAFIKNLPVEKVCKYENDGTCFAKRTYFTADAINTKGNAIVLMLTYKALLNNGIGIAIRNVSPTCDTVRDRCGEVYIDVNGPSNGPNRLSRDIFDFAIYKDKVDTYDIEANHFPNCVYGGGHACAAYLLQFRNRNYKSYKNYVKRHNVQFVNMTNPYEKSPFSH